MASVKQIFDETIKTDHKVITEELSKSILKSYGIKVPGYALVTSADVPCGMVSRATTLSASTSGMKVNFTQPPPTSPRVKISVAIPTDMVR